MQNKWHFMKNRGLLKWQSLNDLNQSRKMGKIKIYSKGYIEYKTFTIKLV